MFGSMVTWNDFEWIDYDYKWIKDKVICVYTHSCESELNYIISTNKNQL